MLNSQQAYLMGQLIKRTPEFRGKWRLINYWMGVRGNARRLRRLPGGCVIPCDISVPYEAMVWLEREEQGDLELLSSLLKPGQTFVDCGANIGLWTLVAAAAVGSSGRVYAFEPNPVTFTKLSDNATACGEVTRLFNLAVGSNRTQLLFECNPAHNLSRIVTEANASVITVPVVSLDSVLPDEPISGIKIDVEGFELETLRGGESILRKWKPWLCVEFNTLLAQTESLNEWGVHHFLRSLGYQGRLFHDALDTSPDTILPDAWRTTGYCNLFYFPA